MDALVQLASLISSSPDRPSAHREPLSWMPHEDDALRQAVSTFGTGDWRAVAQYVGQRTEQQCMERYQTVSVPLRERSLWSREEDDRLRRLVEKYGAKYWTRLAEYMPGRHAKQCRERWLNHLDPSVNHGEWTEEENVTLIKMQAQIGNHWSKFREYLPGRPDNSIKNQWHTVLKPLLEGHSRQRTLGGTLGSAFMTEAELVACRSAAEAVAQLRAEQGAMAAQPSGSTALARERPGAQSAREPAGNTLQRPSQGSITFEDWSPQVHLTAGAPAAVQLRDQPLPAWAHSQPSHPRLALDIIPESAMLPSCAAPVLWPPAASAAQQYPRPAGVAGAPAPGFMPYTSVPANSSPVASAEASASLQLCRPTAAKAPGALGHPPATHRMPAGPAPSEWRIAAYSSLEALAGEADLRLPERPLHVRVNSGPPAPPVDVPPSAKRLRTGIISRTRSAPGSEMHSGQEFRGPLRGLSMDARDGNRRCDTPGGSDWSPAATDSPQEGGEVPSAAWNRWHK